MLKKIRSVGLNFNPSFIGIYDNILTKKECEILISLFEKSHKAPGVCRYYGKRGVNPEFKKSIEIPDCRFSNGNLISNIISTALASPMIKYREQYPDLTHIFKYQVDDDYTFKKFETEDDGFKRWHCEAGSGDTAKRVLVWAFYLNNAESGTEFMHFPTVRAKMGRCVIWPAGWTHIHRSAPNKGLKYYLSGWISYEK